ncbi:hypothetical protein JTB14_007261 [Gonioctena quinquepunctata]|nr:hypothetical protein JTB14_007261 [Gonioctena quinquepunctata]
MGLWQRSYNALVKVARDVNFHYVHLPQQNALMKKHFPRCSDLNILAYNISLLLMNSHESFAQAVPHVPNMISIGGFHIQPTQELPKDLQEFMDQATEGVFFFSMGAFLPASKMAQEFRDTLFQAFARIDQKIIWKWEGGIPPEVPDNVRMGKWFPQQDILAHPNLRVFITHGGISSIIESIHHGVPLLVLPVFGDQISNAVLAEQTGYGKRIMFNDITEEKLILSLNELLNNPKYRETAQQRSSMLHDQPMKPMDLAVYWTEFVIRHRGAPHLRVAGLDIPWYKYHLVDLFAFIISTIIAVLLCLYLITRRCRSHHTYYRKLKKN